MRDRLVILSACLGAMLTSCIVFPTFLPARDPAVARQLLPDKHSSPLTVPPLIPRCALHEAINGNVAFVPSTFDEHGPPVRKRMATAQAMQDRFAHRSYGRTGIHVPKFPLVDVQFAGAEGGGEASSYDGPPQAEMKQFEHEAFGGERSPRARTCGICC